VFSPSFRVFHRFNRALRRVPEQKRRDFGEQISDKRIHISAACRDHFQRIGNNAIARRLAPVQPDMFRIRKNNFKFPLRRLFDKSDA